MNLTGSDEEETVTDDSGVDFESPEPGGRAVAADVDTGSDLSPAMQGCLAGKGTGGYLSSHQGRMARTVTGPKEGTTVPGLAGRLAGKDSEDNGVQEYVIDRILMTDGGHRRYMLWKPCAANGFTRECTWEDAVNVETDTDTDGDEPSVTVGSQFTRGQRVRYTKTGS